MADHAPPRLRIVAKHALIVRWTHWTNFVTLAIMVWSGLLIYWASPVYRIGLGPITLFHFFPRPVYRLLGLEFGLAKGMAWHFTFGWLFALNGLVYLVALAVTREWRELLPARRSWREALQVVRHDLGLTREPPPPQGKLNAAQRILYTAIIAAGAGSVVTGLAIYKPVQLGWLTRLLGGYPAARAEHFALTIGYLAFFVLHVTQGVRSGWNNLRAIVTGWVVTEEPVETGAVDA